jgi:hypothetical protein
LASRDLKSFPTSRRNFPACDEQRADWRPGSRNIIIGITTTTNHNHTHHNMPPKGQAPARVGGGRPAQSNTSYVRNAINELSSPENRSVVVAVSFFAVSNTPS